MARNVSIPENTRSRFRKSAEHAVKAWAVASQGQSARSAADTFRQAHEYIKRNHDCILPGIQAWISTFHSPRRKNGSLSNLETILGVYNICQPLLGHVHTSVQEPMRSGPGEQFGGSPFLA